MADSTEPGASVTSVTAGLPSVTVPVLSSTMVEMSPARSSAAPPLMSTPSSAPFPVATITAVGTASPIAHGQAMISTATAAASARTNPPLPPATYQVRNVPSDISITTGTNTELIRSASRWMGARVPCASFIICTMRASVLSAPSVVARYRNAPEPLIVPPTTRSPAALATGIGSPVSIDSSTALAPLTTSPSTGTRSPGRTRISSPRTTESAGTSVSAPSRNTRAVFGCRSMSRRIAPAVTPFARASSAFPTRMSAMMMTTAS